eukprot:745753-Hanusia_phi.AAC.4
MGRKRRKGEIRGQADEEGLICMPAAGGLQPKEKRKGGVHNHNSVGGESVQSGWSSRRGISGVQMTGGRKSPRI